MEMKTSEFVAEVDRAIKDSKLHEPFRAADIREVNKETGKEEGIKQGHERLVVLKQMCANGFTAILIAATLIVFHHFCPDGWRWLLLSWSVVLLASLFWGHRVHMLKQYTRERVFMERRERQRGGGRDL